jgi:hypothetical protein
MSSRCVEIQLPYFTRGRAYGPILHRPMIDAHHRRDAHRCSGKEQLITNVKLAAIDGPLHNALAEFPKRQVDDRGACDPFEHVLRDVKA